MFEHPISSVARTPRGARTLNNPPPRDGLVLLNTGYWLAGLAWPAFIAGMVAVVEGDAHPMMPISAALLGAAGTVSVVFGHRQRQSFRDWTRRVAAPPPRPGASRIVAGIASLAVGLPLVVTASYLMSYDARDWETAMLVTGLAGAAGGAGLIVFGARDHQRRRRWRASFTVPIRPLSSRTSPVGRR